jgi:hypothetical protein
MRVIRFGFVLFCFVLFCTGFKARTSKIAIVLQANDQNLEGFSTNPPSSILAKYTLPPSNLSQSLQLSSFLLSILVPSRSYMGPAMFT